MQGSPDRKLTLKQRHFVKAYVQNGGNATQAAWVAYDTEDYYTAKSIGCENLTKPYISEEIDRLMEAVELSTKDSLRAIKDAFSATDKNDYPDHRMRLKAAVMLLKLKGAYPRDRQTPHQQQPQQHIHETQPLDVIIKALKHD